MMRPALAFSKRRSGCAFLMAGLAVMLGGCPTQSPGPVGERDDDGSVSFERGVQPILTQHCAGCHSPGGAADLFGIALQLTADVSYGLLIDQASVQRPELTQVVPGDSASSLLFDKISSSAPMVGVRMPRFAPPLSQTEIDLVRDWIDQGAPNN